MSDLYLKMEHLSQVQLNKVKMRTGLKNQIIGHMGRIFQGVVIKGRVARECYEPLFVTDFWSCRTLQQYLILICLDPRQLATLAPKDLRQAFHSQGFALGATAAVRIITYAQKVLLPDSEVNAIRCEILARSRNDSGTRRHKGKGKRVVKAGDVYLC